LRPISFCKYTPKHPNNNNAIFRSQTVQLEKVKEEEKKEEKKEEKEEEKEEENEEEKGEG
jgi:hypothetical protein